MMREAGHRHFSRTFCQNNIQSSGNQTGIFKKGFIKIADTEEQQKIGVPFLYLQILAHHGRVLFFGNTLFFAHLIISYLTS